MQQLKIKLDLETIYLCVPFNIINLVFCYICIFKNYTELISWELTSWEVDLVGIDLVGVDFVGLDLVGGHRRDGIRQNGIRRNEMTPSRVS